MTQAHLVARRQNDATVLAHARATYPVRLLQSSFPGSNAGAVCLVTFGGGLVDGDAVDVSLEVEPDATLIVFTQASTKVFRGSSSQSIRARVAGTLLLVPDAVACFAGARYTQRIDVAVEDAGRCVLLDGFTSGRAAHGERWAFDRIDLRTTIALGGRELLRDALVLDENDGQLQARAGRYEAFATAIAVGAAPVVESILAASRLDADAAVAPSPLPALARGDAMPAALARVAATTPARALAEARRCIAGVAAMGLPDPFGSRH